MLVLEKAFSFPSAEPVYAVNRLPLRSMRRRVAPCSAAVTSAVFPPAVALTQVRHETGRKWAKPFRINSRSGRVYTTFAIEFEAFGEADVELVKEGFLFEVGFG